jgi:hypothetical protein
VVEAREALGLEAPDRPRWPIWSFAGDLSLEIGDLAERLQAVADTLEELVRLAPGDDEFGAGGQAADDDVDDTGLG